MRYNGKLPFPDEVVYAVLSYLGEDFYDAVEVRDVFEYHRYVQEVTDWGLDGSPEEYGFYLPSFL